MWFIDLSKRENSKFTSRSLQRNPHKELESGSLKQRLTSVEGVTDFMMGCLL